LLTAIAAGRWLMAVNDDGAVTEAFARKIIHGGLIQADTITAAFGQIGDLAVDTLQIQDNAVTVPVSAYTAGAISVDATPVDVVSASITCNGAPIEVRCTAIVVDQAAGGGTSTSIVIKRDTTVIFSSTNPLNIEQNNGVMYAIANISDTPTAGTYTYHFYIQWDDCEAEHRQMMLLETQK